VPMTFRVTDIETLVDESAWTRNDPTFKLIGGLPRRDYGSGDNGPALEPLVEMVSAFPPPYACRVVSISYVDVCFDASHEPRYWFDKCYTECLWDVTDSSARADALERRLLAHFNGVMTGSGEVESSLVHLVTWNGRGFDLPVILMRSMRHQLACKWYYGNRNMRYRYSDEGHCDLMDSLGDYGAVRAMKLGDVARSIGLPGKTDMSGDKVSVLYEESRKDPSRADDLMAKTARYCLQDSIQTALVWLRTRHLYGKVTSETHNAALETFRASKEISSAIDLNWEGLLL
jgi:hypothetical protein